MTTPYIWLRAETKPHEQRAALSPSGVQSLLDADFKVTVEDSAQSIFAIDEYRALACEIAPAGSWVDAPDRAFILGLKELPEDRFPLRHRHIYFAHAYKGQAGAAQILSRFVSGGGALLDLEYLTFENGRRVAAFGYWAGFAGAALGILAWAYGKGPEARRLSHISSYPSQQELVAHVAAAMSLCPRKPAVMVIGAKGRSGQGAVDMCKALNLETIEWDLAETKRGGPFPEINQADILVNCVLAQETTPPFLTRESLADANRRLSVICDVSCDPYCSYNPLPVYDRCTTFEQPCLSVISGDAPLELIAIDHLPSLLPRESSEDFCAQLLPHLLALSEPDNDVWERARRLFQDKIKQL